MNDQSPLTVTCDFFHEFEDDATGFKEEAALADPPLSPGFPSPEEMAAAKTAWVDAIRRHAAPTPGAATRFVVKGEGAGGSPVVDVTVRVGRRPVGLDNSVAVKSLRATEIDITSDHHLVLVDGSVVQTILWTDIAHITFTPTCAAPAGPAAAG